MYGQRVSRSFKDISLSFDPHPVTKDLPVIRNERAISRAVRNLVQTIPGEKFFRPLFGSGVRGLLFDFMDVETSEAIEEEIITVINNYEPRCRLVQVHTQPEFERNGYNCQISFYVQNYPDPVVVESFLERLR